MRLVRKKTILKEIPNKFRKEKELKNNSVRNQKRA